MNLQEALADQKWQEHKLGDVYHMVNVGGKRDEGWKLTYYPLMGTYKGEEDAKTWIEFEEPRALIEKPMGEKGNDFREMPLRYLIKTT